MRDTFPIWPPTSPQIPNLIPGRQVLFAIQDLRINQSPRGNSREIEFVRQRFLPRIRGPEFPVLPELRNRGKIGPSLEELFYMTENAPRAELVRALNQ
jgi:hypothetical protein